MGVLEDLRQQVPELLEKEMGGGLRQVARQVKINKKIDTVSERLQSGSFYKNPDDLLNDLDRLLKGLPDTRLVLSEFRRLYSRWQKDLLPKGVYATGK